jgi:acetyl-CoA carboxylase biotin carboxyl carrier protein
MGGSVSGPDIFDVRKVRRLVELMNDHDLSEMDLRQGDMRIQLRREKETTVVRTVEAAPVPVPVPAPAQAAPSAAAAEAPPVDENIALVISPMIGTFYSSPDPDAEPYVKIGEIVSSDATVCIIEAMKVFNEIQSEVSGKVVAMLVENGEPVEFGQPLFKVDTRK